MAEYQHSTIARDRVHHAVLGHASCQTLPQQPEAPRTASIPACAA